MTRFIVAAFAALLVVGAAGPAVGATEGSPSLSVHLPDNHVDPGERATLELFLLNGGNLTSGGSRDDESRVTTARNVTVSVRAGDAPIEVRTGTRPVGNVPEGRVGPIPVAITVAESAEPGRYTVPVTVSYNYTRRIDSNGHEPAQTTIERSVPLVVEERPDFAVVNATADLAVGETGDVTLRLRNVGDATATDATVMLQSDDPGLSFGESPTAASFVGEWAPGGVKTVRVSAAVSEAGGVRPYPVSAAVSYRDADGQRRETDAGTTGVTPRVEQSFALANVTSTLAVGDEGTLQGTITNTGPVTVRNAVVVFSAENANVVPVETEYAVGDLGSGDSATFAFDAEVSDSADAGPRQLSVVVRFRDSDDEVRRSDPLDARVQVGPRRGVFTVEPTSATFDAGESGVFELRVTNAGDQVVTDVSAKVFTDDPLSSGDDEAFIDRLEPGQSATVRFELTTGAEALRKVYPVSLDFQYDDAEGDTRLSDTYDVPVEVTGSQGDGGLPVAVIGAALIVGVALVAGSWYRRRR